MRESRCQSPFGFLGLRSTLPVFGMQQRLGRFQVLTHIFGAQQFIFMAT